MPIFEQGYQHWQGRLAGRVGAWWAITRHGVRTQFRNRWTKMLVFSAWIPALALAAVLIGWGLFEQKAAFFQYLIAMFRNVPHELREGPRTFRMTVWTLSFFFFFQVQMPFSMLLVQLVGPALISQDLRFNALPLYFSRPLRRLDYFLGKLGVIGFYLAAVAIMPILLAYVLGVCFSLDFSIIRDTSRLLAASLLYGMMVVASAGTLMLALSSLSRNSRYVGALWMGLWIIGNMTSAVLLGTTRAKWPLLISYTSNLERFNAALLNTDGAWKQLGGLIESASQGDSDFDVSHFLQAFPWWWSAAVLAGLFGVSVWILTLRVRSLDRLR